MPRSIKDLTRIGRGRSIHERNLAAQGNADLVGALDRDPVRASDIQPPNIDPDGRWGWTRPRSRLQFVNNDINPDFGPRGYIGTGSEFRAIFETPIFDLRPDLRARSAYEPIGAPVLLVPASGVQLDLFFQITGMENFFTIGSGNSPFRLTYVESGHPENPNLVAYYTDPIDITASAWAGNTVSGGVVGLHFIPDGPLRYWRCTLILDADTNYFTPGQATGLPPVAIAAALN